MAERYGASRGLQKGKKGKGHSEVASLGNFAWDTRLKEPPEKMSPHEMKNPTAVKGPWKGVAPDQERTT